VYRGLGFKVDNLCELTGARALKDVEVDGAGIGEGKADFIVRYFNLYRARVFYRHDAVGFDAPVRGHEG